MTDQEKAKLAFEAFASHRRTQDSGKYLNTALTKDWGVWENLHKDYQASWIEAIQVVSIEQQAHINRMEAALDAIWRLAIIDNEEVLINISRQVIDGFGGGVGFEKRITDRLKRNLKGESG